MLTSNAGTPCAKCGVSMTSYTTVNGLACCDWCKPKDTGFTFDQQGYAALKRENEELRKRYAEVRELLVQANKLIRNCMLDHNSGYVPDQTFYAMAARWCNEFDSISKTDWGGE